MQKFVCSFYLGGTCNFTCSYCHQNKTTFFDIHGTEKPLKSIKDFPQEILEKSVGIISKLSLTGIVHINFFGGETFLFSKNILFVLDLLETHCNISNISLSISTNGSIIDKEVLNRFNNFLGIKSIIDVSWHLLEHSHFEKKILENVEELKNYKNIHHISTVVIDKNCFVDYKKYFQLFYIIHNMRPESAIVLNIHYGTYWSTKEISDLLHFFSLILGTRVYEKFHIQIETINCGALQENTKEIFFLPQGDVLMCPYLVMDKFPKDIYEKFSCGNILLNSIEHIFMTLTREKKLYCKNQEYNKKNCFFLSSGISQVNRFITQHF